jgi:hypothetical protein
MTISEAINHIPTGSVHDLTIKLSGLMGAGTSFAGLTSDLSHWTEVSQVIANLGIGLSGLVAALAFCYSIYKSIKKKPNDKPGR